VDSRSDFFEVEHTADWAIRVRGATLPDLFVNAATGMYSLVADLPSVTLTDERAIEVKGDQRNRKIRLKGSGHPADILL
jgi:SHS2 domain-containing protein